MKHLFKVISALTLALLLSSCSSMPSGKAFVPGETQINAPLVEEATLLSVGDNLIHSPIMKQSKVENGYDFTACYKQVADYIRSADIATINQESLITNAVKPSSYPRFATPVEMGYLLDALGIDIVSVANNHAFDKGALGIESSLDFYAANTAIQTVGAYRNKEDYDAIRTLTRNNITFSFIAATEHTNGLSIRNSDVILLRTRDEEAIINRIIKAKELSDVVVVNVHWGVEYTNDPNDMQKNLAKKMVDAGADIIIGHHPHVLQPIKYIERADGTRAVVAYSLGNFFSSQDRVNRLIGGMLDVTVSKNMTTAKIEIAQVKLIPIVTHYEYAHANIQVMPAALYTEELAAKHRIKKLSVAYVRDYVTKVIAKEFLH